MEPSLTVRLARITGTPSQTCWSQTHTFFPEEEKKRRERGILLACLSFSGAQQGVETVATGREILSRLHEEFYGELSENTFLRLASTVDKVCQEFSGEEQSLEIVAACVLNNVLYLSSKGGGQVWVRREGLFQKVLTGKAGLERASGFLKEGDFLILGTASFFEIVPQGVLKASLETGEPQEAVEALAPLIGGQDDASKIAAIIGKVEEEEPVEEVVLAEAAREDKEKDIDKGELFKRKISGFLGQFLSKVSKFPPGKIYLRSRRLSVEEEKKKKVVFTIACLLILLLGVSLFFGTKKREAAKKQEEYDRLYQEIAALLEGGQAMIGLNPASSREQLFEASDRLSELESLAVEEEKTTELKERIKEALSQVIKEKKIEEAPVFFDLGLVAAEAKGDRLCLGGDYLFVLDKEKTRLFSVEIAKKSGEILAGGESLSEAKFLTSDGASAFILVDKGIFQVDLEGKKGKLIIKKDEDWGEIGGLASYGGNLYLLDKAGKIWRYLKTEEGFGTGKNWFREGISPDLSQGLSMAIDGSIWVLNKNGKILKFTMGALDPFGVAGLEKDFDNPVVLDTDFETENLYVFDRGNGRVVVLAKSGEYQFQYQWEGLSRAQDIVVSEKHGKIFILAGEKIYEIDLE